MQATCLHCATRFSASTEEEEFCCRGCEYVHELIHHKGLDRFYELRGKSAVRPVRSVPFESQDLKWLEEMVAKLEDKPNTQVEGDFSLEGLSCVGCVWLVEHLFLKQPGAISCHAHPATGVLNLRWTSATTDLAGFAREMATFGYSLTPRQNNAENGEARRLGARLGLCAAFAMNGMVFTLPRYVGMPDDFPFAGIFQLVVFFSATLAMLVGGSYFIKRAWQSVRIGVLHMDLPIALGIILAFIGSIIGWVIKMEALMYFDFVGMFIFLMLGGRYLQLSAIEKNRRRLHRRRPVPESVFSPDTDQPTPLGEIVSGFRYLLEPGQSAPVSSVLDSAPTDFSLEWITGEADPQTWQPGRRLPAGAIHLGRRPAILSAQETWENSLLSRLTATDRRSVRIPALEKLLRFYLSAVILIGIVGFIVAFQSQGAASALQIMISVFVVSCPCALGVAIPYADELAGSRMERMGVFIRENLLWSRLKSIRTIIFDKTGTLTLERPVLQNPEAIETLENSARQALAFLTHDSLHPVSRSLLEALGLDGQDCLRSADLPEINDQPGAGRFYESDGETWSLGRPDWIPGRHVSVSENPSPHDAELRCDGEVIGSFVFRESLRPDAVAALEALRKRNYRLVILSGDRPEKVAAAAKLLQIPHDDAHAALQPAEKEEIVRKIDHHDTLFLGDGANYSLAFNAAWATGTPVVDRSLLESKADFFFLGKGLRFLPALLSMAKVRTHTIKAAFIFALIYNAAAITFALLGHMSPLVAAIIMPLSSAISLMIVGHGLRERKVRIRKSKSAERIFKAREVVDA